MSKENLKRLKDNIGYAALEDIPRQIASIVDFTSFQNELENITEIVEEFTNKLWINSAKDDSTISNIGDIILDLREAKISPHNLTKNITSIYQLSQNMFTLHDVLLESSMYCNYAQRFYFLGTKLSVYRSILKSIQRDYPVDEKYEAPPLMLMLDYDDIHNNTVDYLKFVLTRNFFKSNKDMIRRKLKGLRFVNMNTRKESISPRTLQSRIMSTSIVFEEGTRSKDLYKEIENNYRAFYLKHLLDYCDELYSWLNYEQLLKSVVTESEEIVLSVKSKLEHALNIINDNAMDYLTEDDFSFNRIKFDDVDKNFADPLYKDLCKLFKYNYQIKMLHNLCDLVLSNTNN